MHTSMIEIKIPAAENITVTEDTLRVDWSDGRTIFCPSGMVSKISLCFSHAERNKVKHPSRSG